MVLVTGGTGFLGAHLLLQLLKTGEEVRCIFRNKEFKYLTPDIISKIDWIQGDILDMVSLETAMQGIKNVYHCAGKVSFDKKDSAILLKVNAEGTANVVNSCINQKIEKLVHVSSVAAIGRSRLNKPINETIEWEDHVNNSPYAKSKFLAEMEVWRGMGEGLSTVIVNPSILLGPSLYWDEGAPKLIKTIAKGFSYYTPGINGFTDVRDVAQIMICLMNHEASGERFIINTANWSYYKLFKTIRENLGLSTELKAASPLMSEIVWRAAWLKSILTQKKQLITRETTKTASQKVYYDNSKILQCFPNFQFTALEKTIADACEAFLAQQGDQRYNSMEL